MKLIHALKLPLKYLFIGFISIFFTGFFVCFLLSPIVPYTPTDENFIALINIGSKIMTLYIYMRLLRNETEDLNTILKINKLSSKNIIIITIFAIAFTFCKSLLGSTSLTLINTFTTYTGYNKIISSAQSSLNCYLALFNLIIIGPIFEEILLRGMIFNSLKKNLNIVAAIILQAFIFSILHGNIIQCIYTFASGIIYGVIYLKTNSLLAPILMHIIGNFVGTVGMNFVSNNLHDYIRIIDCSSILIAIVSFIWIMRINSNNKSKCTLSIKE